MINFGHIKQRVIAGVRDEGGIVPAALKAVRLLVSGGVRGLVYGDGYQVAVNYEQWVKDLDTVDESMRENLRRALSQMNNLPTISVLMPTYETDLGFLRAAVDSVKQQTYKHWQLCIADDASRSAQIHTYLKTLESDPRISVVFRPSNGHISASSNSALALAVGEWCVLLDHDDLLTEDALACIALEICRHPEAELIYSDEDKLDRHGRRARPYFKPDFNLELLRGNNYLCHLVAYRRQRLVDLGGFREGYEGAQDHDLALRYVEGLPPDRVLHIPKVLYHWREHQGSTSTGMGVKQYALAAGQLAVKEHLERCGLAAEVSANSRGYYTVKYVLPKFAPLVTIIIPTRNGIDFLEPCVESLFAKTTYKNFEVLIIDNGSSCSRTLEYLAQQPDERAISVIRDESPFNFSYLNNLGAKTANGDFILLLNNDTAVINPHWLDEMVATALTPGVGIVGARLLYPDDTVQHAGLIMGIGGSAGHAFKHASEQDLGYWFRMVLRSEFSAVTGACLLVSKALYNELMGLDELAFPVAFNDVDFCLRVRSRGLRVILEPGALLYHFESKSRGYEDSPEKLDRFSRERSRLRQRWISWIENDPAYNPNLTREHEHFSLRRAQSVRKGRTGSVNLSPDQFDELSSLASAVLITQLKLIFNIANPSFASLVFVGHSLRPLALKIATLRPQATINLWVASGLHRVECLAGAPVVAEGDSDESLFALEPALFIMGQDADALLNERALEFIHKKHILMINLECEDQGV